ncbi:GNAT family N-acetyltransferase [Flagellimonas sp. S3867]|uniref:GNAT family N-acetyltransferase n=1 Tax=Flagellimonas sp. S3867 TaxID=2768063 RepID=UPI0016859974|nr:GNAT family N-acetyltransferase [Flagellimonas sp. S3867]
MIIKNNPFTSEIYNQEWMGNFHKGKKCHKFSFIKKIAFVKNKYLPLYINVGKYKSCGISYELDKSGRFKDYKGKVFLIYDVPEFIEVNAESKSKNLGLKKNVQYEGYFVDIRSYGTIEDYLSNQFNSKQRHRILSRLRKLEKDHNISYEFYSGKLEKKQFEQLFNELYNLMKKQFNKKNEKNSHSPIEIKEWYRSLFFTLFEKNQASFSLIKKDETTISSCFSYNSDNMVFSSIPVLDLDYSKYGLGNIRSLKSIEWAIKNGFEYYDLGKGSYGYKHRWASSKYKFEYHILFDKKSILASSIAFLLESFFNIKQLIRKTIHALKK